MKQLEVINFASLTEKNQPKHNTKLFHNYENNIWLKNMQLIESKRCFVLFRNEESEF